jgi:MYXO-CTERM domain-containing protein
MTRFEKNNRRNLGMRFNTPLMAAAAAALFVASPALAQNTAGPTNTTDLTTGNTVTTNGMDPGMAGAPPPGATTDPTGAAAAPGAQSATLPPDANAGAIDTTYAQGEDEGGRFPWGLLGLLGLLGFLGRRRRDTGPTDR